MTDRHAIPAPPMGAVEQESPYAWVRLTLSLGLSTVGCVGMWSAAVTLPAVQAEFAVSRADASLPYTVSAVSFVFGQVMMGKLADRFGVAVPAVIGTVCLALGYVAASYATALWQLAAVYGVLIGLLGCTATFGPVIADISLWFTRRRGIAVAIASCGSYLAGTVWPPVIQHFTTTAGWRQTHFWIGVFSLVTMLPLALSLRRRAPVLRLAAASTSSTAGAHAPVGMSPAAIQGLLMVAGVACCVAMSMPQVHIVALCADLGYGAQRGAEMLSVMLGTGIISRLASGWVSDRIGPLITLLIGSGMQAVSLLLYLPFDGLLSLYIVSALFGLFQGGIVPSYALIIRENFPPAEAGMRITSVLSATVAGMALGGWISGAIYDLTLSYQAAFLNGFAWNLLNLAIAGWLLAKLQRRRVAVA